MSTPAEQAAFLERRAALTAAVARVEQLRAEGLTISEARSTPVSYTHLTLPTILRV